MGESGRCTFWLQRTFSTCRPGRFECGFTDADGCFLSDTAMKQPSQHTWELIRGLYASQSLWEKLVGNQEPSLSLFDEIGATDEALAIPHLTPFLLSGRSQVRDAAARSIGRMFNIVGSSDYPHLDEACR